VQPGRVFVILQTAMSSEQTIKDLCARVIDADDADFTSVVNDLHAALKAHIEKIRAMAVAALVNPPTPPTDLPHTTDLVSEAE
jgi:hypothetical protein